VVFVVAAASVCALGCGRRIEQSKVTMRIGIGVPTKTSPGSGGDYVITSLRMEPWLTSRADGRQAGRIATGWTWDDSRTVLTLKLRSDVYFHDGTKMTPELAADILRASVNGHEAKSFSRIVSVEARPPDAVQITLKEPNAFVFPTCLSPRSSFRETGKSAPVHSPWSGPRVSRRFLRHFPTTIAAGRPSMRLTSASTPPSETHGRR